MKMNVACIFVAGALALHAEPTKVIFDTDMYTDCDDAGTLVCLHALADEGECEILATVANTRESMSVAMCEIGCDGDLSHAAAFDYLRRYQGIAFLVKCYEAEHTLSFDDAGDDLCRVCRRNGGRL